METVDAFLNLVLGPSGQDQASWSLRGEGFRCGVPDAFLVDAGDEDGAIFDCLRKCGCNVDGSCRFVEVGMSGRSHAVLGRLMGGGCLRQGSRPVSGWQYFEEVEVINHREEGQG